MPRRSARAVHGESGIDCCQSCGNLGVVVVDTRLDEPTGWRRRRRECTHCRVRWNTLEVPEVLLAGLLGLHLPTSADALDEASDRAQRINGGRPP